MEYASSAEEPPLPTATGSRIAPLEPPDVLNDREEETVALIARGLTNRRIAEEFSISGRTVDAHVARILKKLGLHSREQFADYVERCRHEAG